MTCFNGFAVCRKRFTSNVKYGYQRDIAVEDEVTAILDYGNGATGVFITCTHDIIGTDRFEILGDKGKIVVDDSKKVTIKRLKQSENEMNATMDWADAMKIFMGGGLGDIYDEEVIEFESVWGAQHMCCFGKLRCKYFRWHTISCTRKRWY